MLNIVKKRKTDGRRPSGAQQKTGQSATELAIFGSILMFVIGLIVRAGLFQGQGLNAQLRSMRMALTESYRTAHGYYRGGNKEGSPAGARNSAAIMLVEDRMSVDSAQALGTRDRVPLITSGAGTYSHNLFWSMDYGNQDDLPMFDLVVNGQRFPLTTARFMRAHLMHDTAGERIMKFCYDDDKRCKMFSSDPDNPNSSWLEYIKIDPCTRERHGNRMIFAPNDGPLCYEPECIYTGKDQNGNDTYEPCNIAFKKIYNLPEAAGEEYCAKEETCPAIPFDFSNQERKAFIDERFDLDHQSHPKNRGQATKDDKYVLPNDPIPGGSQMLRDVFNWQWGRVAMAPAKRNIGNALALKYLDGISIPNNINRTFDIDGDLEEEYIMDAKQMRQQTFYYVDYQEGDIDFSKDGVGLQRDVRVYSKTAGPVRIQGGLYGGTYLLVEEGKLYGVDGQFVRETNRQDHIDLISRFFQLSHNTGRFCQGGMPVDWGPDTYGVKHLSNPVEACGSTTGINRPMNGDCRPLNEYPLPVDAGMSTCMNTNNIDKTCFDVSTCMLYIRSRTEDLRGRHWSTRIFR